MLRTATKPRQPTDNIIPHVKRLDKRTSDRTFGYQGKKNKENADSKSEETKHLVMHKKNTYENFLKSTELYNSDWYTLGNREVVETVNNKINDWLKMWTDCKMLKGVRDSQACKIINLKYFLCKYYFIIAKDWW